MSSLGEQLPKEQARARELLTQYRELGINGVFGAFTIEQALQNADRAVMSGDLVSMMQAYEELKGLE